MMRAAALLGFVAITLFAQEPNEDPDSFDIEPPLLIPNREGERLSNPQPGTAPAREVDLARLEKELERARRNAASAERLCKIGALSKLEAEQRVLRRVHLEFDLANARLVCAKQEMLEKEKRLTAGEIAQTDLAQTETGLAHALEAAHAATAKREQADLDAAEANVHRQEQLPAFGRARTSEAERAAQKLSDLKCHQEQLRIPNTPSS